MKYCPNCGAQVDSTARFCPNCGQRLTDTVVDTVVSTLAEPADRNIGYRIVLFSRGSCSSTVAREVLCDFLGYSVSTAKDLLANTPVEVADELSYKQAIVLAQALAEYGMEVTVVDENDKYINIPTTNLNSVFDLSGALLPAALLTLSTLSAVNRVHRYRKYRKPSLLDLLFRPTYRKKPPVHIRRSILHDHEPSRRITISRPAPPRHDPAPKRQTLFGPHGPQGRGRR